MQVRPAIDGRKTNAAPARGAFVNRLITKAIETGVELDAQLDAVNNTTTPQLKMTDKPVLSRGTLQKRSGTQRPRTLSASRVTDEPSFNQPLKENDINNNRVALSMLRQPLAPRVFAPISKQTLRPR